MTIANVLLQLLRGSRDSRLQTIIGFVTWSLGSCISAELLGYWMHRLMHSGTIGFLSRNHMKHHLILYGPLQKQRSATYYDATDDRFSLGNIGTEWLIPAASVVVAMLAAFYVLHASLAHQLLCLGITLSWSFLMFSYLHDIMHVEGLWLEKNRFLKRWFLSARRLHDIHHRVLNDQGLMNKNFGIGIFLFDRLFGTMCLQQTPFNHGGYKRAKERFAYVGVQQAQRVPPQQLNERRDGQVIQGLSHPGLSRQTGPAGSLFLPIILVLLFVGIDTARVLGQSTIHPQSDPGFQHRCTRIALTSETRLLPRGLITQYLQNRVDFQSSRLTLVPQEDSADAIIVLRERQDSQTSVSVLNRMTGEYRYETSDWTDYPGMVASELMDHLRIVCPGSIRPIPVHRAVKACSTVPAAHRPIVSLAACSKTSWMSNKQIYEALRSSDGLKQSGVQVRPPCTFTDVTLRVTHNLDVPAEWYWELWSADSEKFIGGHVIAFKVKEAAAKIADEAAQAVVVLADPQSSPTKSHRTAPGYEIAPLTASVEVLPNDFRVKDHRVELYVDSEGVKGLDMTGRLVFAIAKEDLRDVRLRTEWSQPFELDDPTPLFEKVEDTANHLFEPTVAIPDALEINLHPAQLALYGAETLAYLGVAPILAQVRTPSYTLDLAWEESGVVKTVSLVVPGSESSELLHALRADISWESDEVCFGSQSEDSESPPHDP